VGRWVARSPSFANLSPPSGRVHTESSLSTTYKTPPSCLVPSLLSSIGNPHVSLCPKSKPEAIDVLLFLWNSKKITPVPWHVCLRLFATSQFSRPGSRGTMWETRKVLVWIYMFLFPLEFKSDSRTENVESLSADLFGATKTISWPSTWCEN
jgi:hypothetical protein